MTLSQGYRMVQAVKHKQPCLDYPYLGIPDEDEEDAGNNKRNNLRLICPNCDSQLDTYKSRNKNSDRIYYHYNHR